jgi:predicted ATPase
MIKNIRLRNFKIFEDQEFDFRGITIITGINGMGKSSVIQSLLLLKQSFEIEYLQTQKKVDLSNDYINLESAEDLLYGLASDKHIEIEMIYDDDIKYNWRIDASNPKAKILDCIYTGNEDYHHLSVFNDNFIFLDAERWGPREEYYKKEKRSYNTKLGIQGELTPAYILNAISENEQIGVHALSHKKSKSSTELYENINFWMSEILGIPLKAKVSELDESRIKLLYSLEGTKGKNYSALQVGFGFTYCLPIIIAVLTSQKGDLILLENPEAHLHPAAQSKLGKFLAFAAHHEIQIITETHSEHIINGVRLSVVGGEIASDNVVINFFSKTEEKDLHKVSVQNIGIQDDGDLSEWPVGFFDQSEQDFIELLKLKSKK